MEIATSERIASLTEKIIGCGIEVHRTLGPGLLESIYRDCLVIEMRAQNLSVERERRVKLAYKGQSLSAKLRLDLLVDGVVVVEVKAVDRLHPVHQAQVITYLKLSGCPAGLLMNFNATSLKTGLRRLSHPDLYVAKLAMDSPELPMIAKMDGRWDEV
jgi:GxxExxY protein